MALDTTLTAAAARPRQGRLPTERAISRGIVLPVLRELGWHIHDYLKDLFTRLPSAKIAEIMQFTHSEWAGSCQTGPVQAA